MTAREAAQILMHGRDRAPALMGREFVQQRLAGIDGDHPRETQVGQRRGLVARTAAQIDAGAVTAGRHAKLRQKRFLFGGLFLERQADHPAATLGRQLIVMADRVVHGWISLDLRHASFRSGPMRFHMSTHFSSSAANLAESMPCMRMAEEARSTARVSAP